MKLLSALVAVLVLPACGGSSSPSNNPGADGGPVADTGGGGMADTGGPADTGSASDAGGGDALPQGDGGSPSCAGYAYCDNFETYPTGTVANGTKLGPWAASVAGVTVTVDTVNPYQSTQSLHIVVAAGASAHGTLTQTKATGLVAGNNMFGRAMLFYSNTGTNGLPLAVHSWLFNSAGTSTAADGGVTMNMGGGGAKLQLNYHPPLPLTEQSVQGGTMTAGAWHCVQWQYDGSGTPPNDNANVWVDGPLAVNAPASKGWNFATPWDTFDFGFTHYQTLANPVEVFLDDFALSDAMIPCP